MDKDAPLRADARQNRERILVAAEEIFMEQGGGASLEAVAKRAGVGIGTLYRRFPTRDELLAATYSERLLAFAEACSAATAAMAPAQALRSFVEGLVVHINIYRGLAASIGMVLQSGTPGCAAISGTGAMLLRQAQDSGAVRDDIAFNDLVHMITAISLAIEQEGGSTARIGQLAGIFFDGLTTRPRA
jgi:AcrR family transcriptional regulator